MRWQVLILLVWILIVFFITMLFELLELKCGIVADWVALNHLRVYQVQSFRRRTLLLRLVPRVNWWWLLKAIWQHGWGYIRWIWFFMAEFHITLTEHFQIHLSALRHHVVVEVAQARVPSGPWRTAICCLLVPCVLSIPRVDQQLLGHWSFEGLPFQRGDVCVCAWHRCCFEKFMCLSYTISYSKSMLFTWGSASDRVQGSTTELTLQFLLVLINLVLPLLVVFHKCGPCSYTLIIVWLHKASSIWSSICGLHLFHRGLGGGSWLRFWNLWGRLLTLGFLF